MIVRYQGGNNAAYLVFDGKTFAST